MRSLVTIHVCTDACTHSHQGMNQKRVGWRMHVGPHRCTYVCMQLCKGGGAEVGESGGHDSRTDTCTHSECSFPFFFLKKKRR